MQLVKMKGFEIAARLAIWNSFALYFPAIRAGLYSRALIYQISLTSIRWIEYCTIMYADKGHHLQLRNSNAAKPGFFLAAFMAP